MRLSEIINSMLNPIQDFVKYLCKLRNNTIEPIEDHEEDSDELSQSLGGIENIEDEMPDNEREYPNEALIRPNTVIVPLTEFNLQSHELSEIIKEDAPETDNDVLCLGSINGRSIYSVKSTISGISGITPIFQAPISGNKKQVAFVRVRHDISPSNSGSQQSDGISNSDKFKKAF